MRHVYGWVVLAGILSGLVAPVDARAQGGKAAEGKASLQRASCVLAVRGGSGGGRDLDIQTVSAAVTSTGVVDPAAQEVLGLGPSAWPDLVSIELAPAGQQAVKLTVTVTAKGDAKLPPDPARKLMDNLVARVTRSLTTELPARKEPEERRAKLEARQAELQKELSDLRVAQDKVMGAMRFAVDRSGPDPIATAKEELLDKTVRVEALEAAFAEVQKARLPQLDAAKALAAAREGLVAKLEAAVDKGQGDGVELARARVALAEARAQVADLSLPPAADPRSRWFDQLVTMRMEIASLERRVEQAKGAAPAAQPSRAELMAEQERLSRVMSQKQNDLQLVNNQLEQVRREINPYGGGSEARLVVLGAGGASGGKGD